MSLNLKLKERLLSNYNYQNDYSGISGKRLAARLEEISKIGLTNDRGSNRLGLSKEETEAKLLIKNWMINLGLKVREDGIGNVFGRLEGQEQTETIIMIGSHIDTVPNGGHFDGVLGVLSALEIIEAWRKERFIPMKNIEIAIFVNEEGGRINNGCLGSKVMMNQIKKEELLKLRDFSGIAFEKILLENNLKLKDITRSEINVENVEAFFEVHIEQGKQLEKNHLPVGIVTGIAGSCRIKINFIGESAHSGNTPMNDRKDALVAASKFITKVEKLPKKISDSSVVTVGKLEVFPNGANVVPGRVELVVDARDIIESQRDCLVDQVLGLAHDISESKDLDLKFEILHQLPCISISEKNQSLVKKAMVKSGLQPFYLPSGAGHDSLIIAQKIPVGMIFIRSKNGHSHTPKEWSNLDDCIQGIHVLKNLIEFQVK